MQKQGDRAGNGMRSLLGTQENRHNTLLAPDLALIVIALCGEFEGHT
jgi:hypothetical protein